MSEPTKSKGRLVTFKRHDHLFTLISVVWTVFTVLGVFFVIDDSNRDGFKVTVHTGSVVGVFQGKFRPGS